MVTRFRVTVAVVAAALAVSAFGPILPGEVAAGAAPTPSSPNLTPGTAGMALRSDSAAAAPLQRAAGGSNQQSPAPNPASDLIQGTGPVMQNPVIYNVFWLPTGLHYESDGLTSSDTRYENLLNRFAMDVGGTNFYNVVTQYPGSNGTPANSVSFGGSWVDTTAYPHAGTEADPLFDANIQAEATKAATTNSWTTDGNHIYLVYTAFNIFQCQTSISDCNFFKTGHTNAYCAYHFAFGGAPTIYAFMGDDSMFGDPGGCSVGVAPNGDAAADAEISTASHEFIEAVTDPLINNWLSSVATGRQEIGDLCNRNDGPHNLLAPGADVYLHGNPYDIQQQWSNAVHGCAMDLNAAKTSIVPPVLSLTKAADGVAFPNTQFNYGISVQNPSDTDAATLLTVSDLLPAGATYVAGSAAPAPSSVAGQMLTWNLGTLAVHDSTSIRFRATAGASPTTLVNCAAASYDDALQIAAQPASMNCANTTVVACTQTITGSSPAVVAGSTDVICVNGGTILGPLVANAGSIVAVNGGTITSSIVGSGSRFLSVCAATVRGNVTSTGATGFVRIGDAANDDGVNCAGNNIRGAVSLSGGTGGAEVGGNQILGNLALNSTSGGVGEDSVAEIEGNTVGGALSCVGDTPAATAGGHPNMVTGSTAACAI